MITCAFAHTPSGNSSDLLDDGDVASTVEDGAAGVCVDVGEEVVPAVEAGEVGVSSAMTSGSFVVSRLERDGSALERDGLAVDVHGAAGVQSEAPGVAPGH